MPRNDPSATQASGRWHVLDAARGRHAFDVLQVIYANFALKKRTSFAHLVAALKGEQPGDILATADSLVRTGFLLRTETIRPVYLPTAPAETLEALLNAQDDWVAHHVVQPDRVWRHLDGLGLDMAQLRQDMDSPEIARRIAQDLADAQSLNVTKTPEYFVNGKPLPSFGQEPLKNLVDEALASAYPR